MFSPFVMLHDIVATIVAIAISIGAAFAGLVHHFTQAPTSGQVAHSQEPRSPLAAGADPFHSGTPAVLGESTTTAPIASGGDTTVIKHYYTQPVIERVVEHGQVLGAATGFLTLNDLAALEERVDAKFSSLATPPAYPEQIAAGGVPGSYGSPPPASYRIDKLDGVTIRNATIIGGSVSGTSGVGGGGIGDDATTTTFFSTVGHFATGIIDAFSSAAATLTDLTTTELVATNATTTNFAATNASTTNLTTGRSPSAPAREFSTRLAAAFQPYQAAPTARSSNSPAACRHGARTTPEAAAARARGRPRPTISLSTPPILRRSCSLAPLQRRRPATSLKCKATRSCAESSPRTAPSRPRNLPQPRQQRPNSPTPPPLPSPRRTHRRPTSRSLRPRELCSRPTLRATSSRLSREATTLPARQRSFLRRRPTSSSRSAISSARLR